MPSARLRFAWALLLVLLALSSANGDATNPHLQHQREREDDTTFDVTDATLSAALTGCGLCQASGLCDHAFKGSPGQFCLTLASGLPCCCPQDAQCVANSYNCRCRRSYNSYTPPNGHPVKVVTRTSSTTAGTKSFSLFSLVLMLLCACCCIRCCCCQHRDQCDEHTQYPQPVYAASAQYGATDQTPAKYPYAYASAPAAEGYAAPYATPYAAPAPMDSGNSYASGAIGAVAGLAGGMLIGSTLGGGNRGGDTTTTTTTTYFDGDSGFGNATSSFDFAGDTGDYGGDSGDFGGDS